MACFFGRVAYELLAQHWAAVEGSSRTIEAEQARLMNTIPNIVMSRPKAALKWGPARLLGDDLDEAVSTLRKQQGKNLVLFAGATSAFIEQELVDEYRLAVFPLLWARVNRCSLDHSDARCG
jgi:dihydrofolate reductase